MQIQALSCPSKSSSRQIRIIINDAAVPLTGIRDCPDEEEGLCPFDTFVSGMQELIAETDYAGMCGQATTQDEASEVLEGLSDISVDY